MDAGANHADGSTEVELQGMLAIIDHHKDAGDHLQEFEHCVSRNEGDPRVNGRSKNPSSREGSRVDALSHPAMEVPEIVHPARTISPLVRSSK